MLAAGATFLRDSLPSTALLGGTWCNFLLSILMKLLKDMLDIALRLTEHRVGDLFNHYILQMKPREGARHSEGQAGT